MLEIFIPIGIKETNLEINKISNKFLSVLKNTFSGLIIKKFEEKYLYGLYIRVEEFDYNLIILCNGEFGIFYFLDYDLIENKNIFSYGVSFSRFNKIERDILNQGKIIENIKKVLISEKLLTNSKKEEIRLDLKKVFFSLAGILFILYKNKQILKQNHINLENYNGLKEYEVQAKLFLETTKIKKIELNNSIYKFENMVNLYLGILEKLLIKK